MELSEGLDLLCWQRGTGYICPVGDNPDNPDCRGGGEECHKCNRDWLAAEIRATVKATAEAYSKSKAVTCGMCDFCADHHCRATTDDAQRKIYRQDGSFCGVPAERAEAVLQAAGLGVQG